MEREAAAYDEQAVLANKQKKKVIVPDQVSAGSRVKVASRWRNMGWGYFPNPLEPWNRTGTVH